MTITATSDNQIRKSNIRNWKLGCRPSPQAPTAERFSATGRYGMWGGRPEGKSLGLDAREPHHLGPLLGFRGDEAAKVGGRARNHCTAQIGEPCLKLGIGEARIELSVELVDDLGRRLACPSVRRRRTRCSPHSPARTQPRSGCPAAPPNA